MQLSPESLGKGDPVNAIAPPLQQTSPFQNSGTH